MGLTLFESALMLHLIADWLLQNEWMSVNKVRLTHPAAWVHGGIHGILLGLLFGWVGGVVLALLHIMVDAVLPVKRKLGSASHPLLRSSGWGDGISVLLDLP